MKWEKRGLIFRADKQFPWMMHHAGLPVADKINDEVLRIYFGPRDAGGKTVVAFIDVDPDDPKRVLKIHDRPVLGLGELGTFDDSGATPSCIINHSGRKYLFYIGWNPCVTVPYRLSIGLAVSDDGGLSFQRVFPGPILDRMQLEPYFCTAPCVLLDEGKWRLWYVSSTGFLRVHGKPEPLYLIKYAESDDGYVWNRSGEACIPYSFDGEAIGRPCVIKEKGRYRMWYCYRGSVDYRTEPAQSYRIGYAESADGLKWKRLDHLVGIDRSPEGWDSIMLTYPYVYEHRGVKYMLYNGNGFGESGIGYAVLTED